LIGFPLGLHKFITYLEKPLILYNILAVSCGDPPIVPRSGSQQWNKDSTFGNVVK